MIWRSRVPGSLEGARGSGGVAHGRAFMRDEGRSATPCAAPKSRREIVLRFRRMASDGSGWLSTARV